jgi:hypothetical protein
MFGVPIERPAKVLCDNQGVVKNASRPESVLSKKHNTIYYHAVREAVAASIDRATNIADLYTKPLTKQCHITLLHSILYNF